MGFDKYTDRARRAIVLANEEARMAGSPEVTTGYLLAGLAHEDGGVASVALAASGVTLEDVRAHLTAATSPGQEPVSGHIPFTARATKALNLAQMVSVDLGVPYVGTEHLLLGLIHEGESAGISVLTALGFNPQDVRAMVQELLRGYAGHENSEWHTVASVGVEFKDGCMLYGGSLASVLSAHKSAHEREQVPGD